MGSFLFFVWAISEFTESEVAVHAEETVVVFGKSVPFKPTINVASDQLTVCGSLSVYVVDSEELDTRFITTTHARTSSSIHSNYLNLDVQTPRIHKVEAVLTAFVTRSRCTTTITQTRSYSGGFSLSRIYTR